MTFRNRYMYMLALLVIAGISIFAILNVWFNSSSLNQSEVEELRAQYPLYSGVPAHVSIKEITLDDIMKTAETLVLAEVIEPLPEYTIQLVDDSDSSEGKLQEKGKEFGLSDTATFISYRIKVMEDLLESEILHNQSAEITIAVSSEFKEVEPELKPGMRIITPISQGTGKHQGKYLYSKYGLYYVTDHGYVLSAYDEGSGAKLTGQSLEEAKSALRKMHSRYK